MFFKTKLVGTIALLAVLCAIVYGFTASTTVPDTHAAYGAKSINGYVASDVHYTLANVNTLLVTTVEFKLDNPANVVKTRFQLDDSSSTAWSFPCVLSDGVWTCTVPPVHISSIIGLDVLAYQ